MHHRLASDPALARQSVFQADPAQGAVWQHDSSRVALVARDFVQAWHMGLVEHFGDEAADLLYRTGYEWGLQEMVRRTRELRGSRQDEAFELASLGTLAALELWWAPLRDAGWGVCTFDLSAAARGILFAEIRGSAVAAALAGAEEPVCHVYAGLLSAAASFIERGERHGIELECRAVKAAVCRFAVGPGETIDHAESWRQQGVAAAEIMRRLR